jgi:hypothetical protein
LRRKQGRARRGQHASVVVPSGRGRNISIAAAMNVEGFIHHRVHIGAYNSSLIIEFLGQLFATLQARGRQNCWIISDNVRFHHTNRAIYIRLSKVPWTPSIYLH